MITGIKVNLENCYGIKKLETTFDFSQRNVFSLYAANGLMKSSFAKTFKDFSEGKESNDLIFKERLPKREIIDLLGNEFTPSQVFVIEPYVETYKSDRVSSLLVNQELKNKYDDILKKIEEEKSILISKLKQLSGLTGRTITVESELTKTFNNKPFFEVLLEMESILADRELHPFSSIIYSKIFEEKVLNFLNTKDFKRQIKEYIDRYNTLLDSSKYLKKGFNHSNASEIQKSLKGNGFFKAKHSVNLYNGKSNDIITNEDDLQAIINKELEAVLSDADIQKRFNEIDSKLTNTQLKDFRDYLFENKVILPELIDLEKFKKEIWYSYLTEQKALFFNVINEYKKGKSDLEEILKIAKEQETDWKEVISIFNKRFNVPFTLELINQEDVMLKSDSPNIKFDFKDKLQNETKTVDENELLSVLSRGERRALYLLNVIFEVRARKKIGQETIFIIDDIADSFDYKNKYAIVEYLKEISEEPLFFEIILTHNFDFHRTVCSRLDLPRENQLNTIKTIQGISIIQERYQNNPFKYWKKRLHIDDQVLVASIPFIRNLAEYTGYHDEYLQLTSLLHYKENTSNIKISDLETIIKRILVDKATLTLPDPSRNVVDLIYGIADEIEVSRNEIIELEGKVVLSMAIRLKSETYMVDKIGDETFWKAITINQTLKLTERFKVDFPSKTNEIEILEQVNLMTPENIHLNSFMYEPILDMANDHLKQLYRETKTALN